MMIARPVKRCGMEPISSSNRDSPSSVLQSAPARAAGHPVSSRCYTPKKINIIDPHFKLDIIRGLFREAFHSIDSSLRDKETVFLVGNTGCGKSTVLNYLMSSLLRFSHIRTNLPARS